MPKKIKKKKLEISPAEQYAQDVIDGKIVACKWVKLACFRHKNDLERGFERGLYFDENVGKKVIDFFGYLRHSKGEWAGQRFVLSPWEQFIVWSLFGWKREDGLRRFRTMYLEVARKAGKSTLIAGLGLFLFIADKEPGAEIYTAATKRDQAKITHAEATRMVKHSPELRRLITIFKDNLSIAETASKFEPLGRDADPAEGLNVHGALIDELHAHRTREMWDVLETATGSRRQPLQIAITTAGFDRNSICWEIHEYSEKILKGVVQDDTFFPMIYTIDDGDDWRDESIWIKANPNLGICTKLDDLQRKALKAQQMPSAVNNFLRKHLDVWVQQSSRWIDIDLWNSNYAYDIDEEELKGSLCYGGLDLSAVKDLTAWVMIFPDNGDSEKVDVLARFWCPEARLTDTTNRYRDQYEAWHREGWLKVTPGDAIDYEMVMEQVVTDITKNFNLKSMSIDRLFQGYQLAMNLSKMIDGDLKIKENDKNRKIGTMGMGFMSMAGPMKELESRLLKKKINHGNNPIMRFMADSLAVVGDPAGNKKPDKAHSQGKIDGIVALLMALDRSIRDVKKRSKYETEGMLII